MSDRKTDGPLDLAQLRTFLAVYRAGSLTAGARLVGVAQPTATAQLRALETALGRRLFERLPRGVAATPVADELAARLAGPMDALESIAGGSGAATPEPPVHLGGPAEALSALVLPALAAVIGDGVRVRVVAGLADDLLAGLRDGAHDLVLSAVRPRGRSVRATPLIDEEFVLVTAPSRRVDPDPDVLARQPLISYAEDLPILRRYWRHVFGVRLSADPALVVPDLRAVAGAVAAGAGISVLPRYLCAPQLADGTLVPVLEPDDPPINTVYLARRAGVSHAHVDVVHDALLRAAASW